MNPTDTAGRPTEIDSNWRDARRVGRHAEVEPQTYFCTFTCYGTWLHGDERGSIDRAHRAWATQVLLPDEERERRDFLRLKHEPVMLDPAQRKIVHSTIEEVCRHRSWRLHALNVRTNHVHVVVTANRERKRVLNDLKSYATRKLKEKNCLPAACVRALAQSEGHADSAVRTFRIWTRGGSARRIDSDESFARAIAYTLEEQ